jgi:polyphosphate kinase 2 (PPK2 family)
VRLDDISAEAPKGMTREKADERLAVLGEEMFEMQDSMFGARVSSVLVVLQGRDGAGKDGAIKKVVGFLNPRGVNVVSFGVPTEEERQHDFLWRVHRHAPRKGEFAIFNRSHYEDVLVVRVHDLAPKNSGRRVTATSSISRSCSPSTTPSCSSISCTSRRRSRRSACSSAKRSPSTAWKLNPTDWKERDYWDEYTEAYEDAISRTAAPRAPWTVVPANAKWYRNLVIAESICEAMRAQRKAWQRRLDEMGKAGKMELAKYRRLNR